MKSNQHTLPLWTQLAVFHDTAEHYVHIDVNGETMYNNTFSPGKKHHIKLDRL